MIRRQIRLYVLKDPSLSVTYEWRIASPTFFHLQKKKARRWKRKTKHTQQQQQRSIASVKRTRKWSNSLALLKSTQIIAPTFLRFGVYFLNVLHILHEQDNSMIESSQGMFNNLYSGASIFPLEWSQVSHWGTSIKKESTGTLLDQAPIPQCSVLVRWWWHWEEEHGQLVTRGLGRVAEWGALRELLTSKYERITVTSQQCCVCQNN